MTIADRLAASGMTSDGAARTAALFARVEAAHRGSAAHAGDAQRVWVPGRIEVLGKHTDYAGGRSLLCAVERGFCVMATARADDVVRVVDAASGEEVVTAPSSDAAFAAGHWANYVHTIARRLARDFAPLAGADITFASDLPIAAGVSSSSALVTALFLAISGVQDLRDRPIFRELFPDDDALAGYLGAVENGYAFGPLAGDRGVGTFGGSEDHTAILRARPRALAQYRFCPVHFERAVPLPLDHSFLIASSGVAAEKTGGALAAYNALSLRARAALERWNARTARADASLGDAVAACGDEVVGVLRGDSPELAERAAQFVAESETIIPASADALARGDLSAFGDLVARSMENAVCMLHNQVPHTVFLVEHARALGAVAASAFGAGFGGSVWALAPTHRAADLRDALHARYAAAFPAQQAHAEFFLTPAGPAAQRL